MIHDDNTGGEYRFLVRPGFYLFHTTQERDLWMYGGHQARATMKPWGSPGEIVTLRPKHLTSMSKHDLGKLEPADDRTRRAYGHIEPVSFQGEEVPVDPSRGVVRIIDKDGYRHG